MSDVVTQEEAPFLMGGRSLMPKQVQIKVGPRTYSDASSLMGDIRNIFKEQECQEVLRQLQQTGALSAEEVANAQQRASAFPSTVTEPTAQRAATIAVGMAAQKGSLPAAKLAALAKLATALDKAGCYDLADKLDEIILSHR